MITAQSDAGPGAVLFAVRRLLAGAAMRMVARAAAWLLLGVFLVLALHPSPELPGPDLNDKILHIIGFGACGGALGYGAASRRAAWTRAALFLAIGVLVEIVQHTMVDGRTGDLGDVAANAIGLALGVAAGGAVVRLIAPAAPAGYSAA